MASIDKLNRMLQDKQDALDGKERDLGQARNTVDMLEVERERNKKEIQRLTDTVNKLRKVHCHMFSDLIPLKWLHPCSL